MICILCIHLSVDGHLSCFHNLAILSSALTRKSYFLNFTIGTPTTGKKLTSLTLICRMRNGAAQISDRGQWQN